jgi:hypothetical protein
MTDVLGGNRPDVIVIPQQAAPPAPPAPPAGITQQQLDEALAKVRQEEKDKLYPTLQELQGKVATFEQEREAAVEAAAEQERQRVAAEEAAATAEQTAIERLTASEERWGQRFEQMEADRQREVALRERETQYAQMLDYKGRLLAQYGEQIDPRFLDYISGNTPEELDQAVALAVSKTAEIAGEIDQALQGQRRQIPLPVSGQPTIDAATLAGQQQQQELTADDIRNMDMSEYAQYRSQLLAAGSAQVRERGLYS